MSGWTAKRFWKLAETRPEGDGFTVRLDGRAVKTPAKAALVVPTRALADAIAEEWQAQDKVVDPTRMPYTRSANAAIDKVGAQRDEVVNMIADYGGTDLLCYRAEGPEDLIRRQAAAWDPLLVWAQDEFDAALTPVCGVMFAPQPEASLARLHAQVAAMDDFALTALHDLVMLSGSLVIGLAAAHGYAAAEDLWQVSRIDETWQEELWGYDEEAAELAATRRAAFLHARRFMHLSRQDT